MRRPISRDDSGLECGDLDGATKRWGDVDRQAGGEGRAVVHATRRGIAGLDLALGVAGSRCKTALRGPAAHDPILATSTASAAISRAAALSSACSKASRPDRAALAKATRWPLASTGGS